MRAIAVKTTRTLNPNQACAFSDLRTSLCERVTKSFAPGKSATKSLAIASGGRAAMGSSCRATIVAVSRAFAFFLGIRARAPASSQGSTSDRASAEKTPSGCQCRSSPIEATRNESNSRPIRGAGAACVISSTYSLGAEVESRIVDRTIKIGAALLHRHSRLRDRTLVAPFRSDRISYSTAVARHGAG